MKKLKNSEGFTLMEMLIVVAIIAILVAIAIPTFTGQLEKAREATDLANLRSAYAEVMASALSGEKATGVDNSDNEWSKTVALTQKVDGWKTTDATVGGVAVPPSVAGHSFTVTYNDATGTTTITDAGATK